MRTGAPKEKTPLKTLPFKRKSAFADRGKDAEKKVHEYLTGWESRATYREFNRLIDTKAAGRIIKAAAADFEFYSCPGTMPYFGLIEVKETEHEYRLDRSRLTQRARLIKRQNCGGVCLVLIYHSTIGRWRVLPKEMLRDGITKGSWDLRSVSHYPTVAEALSEATVFGEFF